MKPFDYGRIRPFARAILVLAVLLGVALVAFYLWHRHQSNERVQRVSAAWSAVLAKEDAEFQSMRATAVEPVDEYFDMVAIPNVKEFLSDFTGVYDSSVFAWKWVTDKVALRGRSDRVSEMVKTSLDKHLGFPDKYKSSVTGSIERYHTLLKQRDAVLRDRAYDILQGEGVNIDKEELAKMLAEANRIANAASFEAAVQDSTVNFAGAMVGKEVGILALQSLIIERVMVAIGTRMGIITVGGSAAAGTAGVGTATGVGAVPAWALAAGEIAITIVVDLAAGWWLEGKAADTMTTQLNDARAETGKQLGAYMGSFEVNLRKQRELLIQKAAR
ncbi:MAG TPA: hypothetical protein PKE29_13025 [Phycisphaerales bacterium]|nr:hypothetical protein [Phycisphaerales bacterium]